MARKVYWTDGELRQSWRVECPTKFGPVTSRHENVERAEHAARAYAAMFRQTVTVTPPVSSGLAPYQRLPAC